MLDGLTAATHWRYAALLRSRFPRVRVDPEVLYLDHGPILTSAGTAAGIDLCLYIVRRDHGADIANRVARRMVVAPHRDGGQAQFIEQPVPAAGNGDPIGTAIAHALDHLDEPLDVDALARIAHLSPRQFSRRFRATTGSSPGRWLIEQRSPREPAAARARRARDRGTRPGRRLPLAGELPAALPRDRGGQPGRVPQSLPGLSQIHIKLL